MTKTFRLPPNFSYSPTGVIRLGSIWTDPDDPGSCLNPGAPIAPPGDIVERDTKKNWQTWATNESSGIVGLWARFLQVVGIDAEANLHWGRAKGWVFKLEQVDIEFFTPSLEYLHEAVHSAPVYTWLAKEKFKSSVYLVTGVMTTSQGSLAVEHSTEVGGKFILGIDGSVAGGPAAAGPKFKMSRKRAGGDSFENTTEIIFAYQLRKIRYEVKTDSAESTGHNKGARVYDTDSAAESEHAPKDASSVQVGILGWSETVLPSEPTVSLQHEQPEQGTSSDRFLLALPEITGS